MRGRLEMELFPWSLEREKDNSKDVHNLPFLQTAPNGLELSCGVTTSINVLSELRSNICGAWLLQIHFLARSEFAPELQPSA